MMKQLKFVFGLQNYDINRLNHMKVLNSSEKPASSSLFVLLGIFLLFYVVGNIVGTAIMMLIGFDKIDMASIAKMNDILMSSKQGWWALMIGQGVGSLLMFLAPAVFYWLVYERKQLSELNFRSQKLTFPLIFITILVGASALPMVGWLAKVNEGMQLPSALSGLETIMKLMEETLAKMTEFLVSFTSFSEYLVAMLVIAFIAGVGEEVLFRGVVQRKIWFGTGNIHLAIWLSAIIFSAIHFQFYGFLPRMVLGAVFGYLYYWSGNLWLPIIGHIFNNGVSVTMMYAHNNKWTDLDMESTNQISTPVGLAGLGMVCLCSYLFFKQSAGRKSETTL
jgi:uncharacterized protein